MFEQEKRGAYKSQIQVAEQARERTGIEIEPTFFGKVMSFFALAVLTAAAGVFVTYNYFMHIFVQAPALMWILFIGTLGIIFTSRMWSTKYPLNRFMFAAFAFITGVTAAPLVGVVAASPDGVAILSKALLASAMVFTAAGICGWTTKMNLSGMRGYLLFGIIALIVVGIMGFFIPWGSSMERFYSGAGILLFVAFTAYEFNKLKYYPQDRYIEAALGLYLSIFNLFILILRFIMAGRD